MAAEQKVGRLEELAHTLQKEVAGKGGALARMEEQASAGGWGRDVTVGVHLIAS